MFTIRNMGGVALFLSGTTFLWLTPSFASPGMSTTGTMWAVTAVLALATLAGFMVATWGLFRKASWWAGAAVAATVLGVAVLVPYWLAARHAGETNPEFNVVIHGLGDGRSMRTRFRPNRVALAAYAGFIALSAYFGSIGMISGLLPVGASLAERLPFHSPVFAGFALALIVGLPTSFVAALSWRRHPRTPDANALAGLLVVGWIAVPGPGARGGGARPVDSKDQQGQDDRVRAVTEPLQAAGMGKSGRRSPGGHEASFGSKTRAGQQA